MADEPAVASVEHVDDVANMLAELRRGAEREEALAVQIGHNGQRVFPNDRSEPGKVVATELWVDDFHTDLGQVGQDIDCVAIGMEPDIESQFSSDVECTFVSRFEESSP
jgi:hypothetical protein